MAEGGSNKLSEEQIYECLKSLNVPVRMNDLKYPSREFIVRVFECFIRDLQIDITSQELWTWEAINHIEEGDLYEEAQLLIILAMSVNHITNPCGLNITIKDLIEPKPKRTKKILNYLIIFWNYYVQKYGRFRAIEETFESERKKAVDIMRENESLDEKYVEMLKMLESMQPSKEELSAIVDAKEEKATKLKQKSEALLSDYQNLKTKEIRLKEQINATELNIIRAKERLEELSLLILSSPKQKQINTEIQTLAEKIKDIDSKTKEYESMYKDEMKRLQQLEEFQKEQEKVLAMLSELCETEKSFRDTVKAIVDAHHKVNDEEDRLKRLQMDLERKENWKLQQEHTSAKVALNKKKQVEALREVLNSNQNEKIKAEKKVESAQALIQKVQEDIDSECEQIFNIIETCKEADARTKEEKTRFMSKMESICGKFKYDCNEVLEVIKIAFPGDPKR